MTLSHGAVCQSPICCTVGRQRQWSRSYSSAQLHRNEVARSEIEDLFPTVRTLVRLTWTPLPSYATAILRPIVRGSGWGCGVYSQHTFNELQLLLVHLKTSIGSLLLYLRPCKRVNHSLWTRGVYCLLVCWKLDFTPGGPLRGIQVSYQQWRRQWIGAQSVSLPLAGWQTRTIYYSQHVGSCDSLALLSSTQQIYH